MLPGPRAGIAIPATSTGARGGETYDLRPPAGPQSSPSPRARMVAVFAMALLSVARPAERLV